MENLISSIISLLLLPPTVNWFIIFKVVIISFGLILLAATIFFLYKASWLKHLILRDTVEFLTFRPYGVKKIEKDWKRILARLETGLESEYKLALIEADSMMEETLKRMGYGGESLAERLDKLTSATLSNIEQIKEAHQVRNNIVHDPDYRLSLDVAKKTLTIYEKAFTDLQAF